MDDLKILKALKNKILSLAMQGKLVKQNENDEPASILLEKIQKEKAALLKQGKLKKEKPLPPINADEVPYKLPKSWKWVRLGEVCDVNPNNQLDDNDKVTFLPMKYIPSNLKILKEMEHRQWKDIKKQYNHFSENDVLLAKITPCFENRKFCIARNIFAGYGAGSTELYVFRCLLFLPEYLLYFFNTDEFVNNCTHNMTGTAGQKRVPLHYIINYLFPLPPLAEQERIVAKIEEITEIIDEIEKNIAENKKLSKVLYNKLLSFAMQGKLVKQDENDEPASILLEKIKAEKEELLKQGKLKKEKPLPPISADEGPYELPKSWKWVRLGDICYNISTRPYQINTSAVKKQGLYKVISQGENFIEGYSDEANKLFKIQSPLVLFGDHTRNVKYITFDFIIGADGTKLLCPYSIHSKFFYYLIEYASQTISNKGYARHFSLLSQFIYPLPPLAEQERIVAKIEEIKEIIDEIG